MEAHEARGGQRPFEQLHVEIKGNHEQQVDQDKGRPAASFPLGAAGLVVLVPGRQEFRLGQPFLALFEDDLLHNRGDFFFGRPAGGPSKYLRE